MNEENLDQLIPPALKQEVQSHLRLGIADAETRFPLNQEDEDAVTGALGQAMSTSGKVEVEMASEIYTYEITCTKIRGRGQSAPEKRLGADGIFQIIVWQGDNVLFRKGLPFQAKIRGGFQNVIVLEQAQKLQETCQAGAVVRFSNNGYTAVGIEEVLSQDEFGESVAIRPKVQPRPLAEILAVDFLNCDIGRIGLSYDSDKVAIGGGKGIWVISADIIVPR